MPYLCPSVHVCRSFGVVLWEMTSYGSAPLSSLTINEVVNKATLSELRHVRCALANLT